MPRRRELEEACANIAAAQWGVLTNAQALGAGMTMSSIQRRCGAGAWVRMHSGTYRLRGWPLSWEQSLTGACLWADGAACRRSAARLWELGCENAPIEIEAQSARWHLTQEKWRRDMERRNRLMLDGWKVLEIGWQDVIRRPREVIRQIETALFNVVVEKRPQS